MSWKEKFLNLNDGKEGAFSAGSRERCILEENQTASNAMNSGDGNMESCNQNEGKEHSKFDCWTCWDKYMAELGHDGVLFVDREPTCVSILREENEPAGKIIDGSQKVCEPVSNDVQQVDAQSQNSDDSDTHLQIDETGTSVEGIECMDSDSVNMNDNVKEMLSGNETQMRQQMEVKNVNDNIKEMLNETETRQQIAVKNVNDNIKAMFNETERRQQMEVKNVNDNVKEMLNETETRQQITVKNVNDNIKAMFNETERRQQMEVKNDKEMEIEDKIEENTATEIMGNNEPCTNKLKYLPSKDDNVISSHVQETVATAAPTFEQNLLTEREEIRKLVAKGLTKRQAKFQRMKLKVDEREHFRQKTLADQKTKIPKNQMPWTSQMKYAGKLSIYIAAMHRRYVATKLDLNRGGTGRFRNNIAELHQMDVELKSEREEFQKFVRKRAERFRRHIYSVCPPFIVQFLEQRNSVKCQRMAGIYGATIFGKIKDSASSTGLVSESCILKQDSLLMELGQIPVLRLPNLERRALIDVNMGKIASCFPPRNINLKSIETDECARKMAEKYGARFVIAASTARLLIVQDCFNCPKEWSIPVSIRKQFSEGQMQPVVYLGKRLAQTGYNQMQIYWRYLKLAVKANFQLKFEKERVSASGTGVGVGLEASDTEKDEDIFADAFTEVGDLESFGVAASPKSKKSRLVPPSTSNIELGSSPSSSADKSQVSEKSKDKNQQLPRHRKTRADARAAKLARLNVLRSPRPVSSTESDTESGKLVMADNAIGDQDKPIEKSVEKEQSVASAFDDLVGNILGKMEPLAASKSGGKTPEISSRCLENASDYLEEMDENFGGSKRYALYSIDSVGPILIRSNIDGFTTDGRRMSLGLKVEYLAQHGAEKMNDSEWLWHWCSATLKGQPYYGTVHVSANTFDCLQIDVRSLDKFKITALNEQQKILVSKSLKRFGEILTDLETFPEGDYIMKRNMIDAKSANLIVYRKIDDEYSCDQVQDLSKMASEMRGDFRVSEMPNFDETFNGIDENEVLIWHKVRGRIPASFFPKSHLMKKGQTVQGSAPEMKRRGRKPGDKKKRRRGRPRKNPLPP